MANVLQAWLPLIVWQQVEAPAYRKGFITVSFSNLVVTALTIRVLHAREISNRKGRQDTDHIERISSSEVETGVSVVVEPGGKTWCT